ncbi:hypothetical protein IU970_004209 [Salmonella enterica subsp. enterica serovar Sandiego]|nr:hypothetical protein [Salmonella enterica subsp. enterica serovar Sandiego]
MEYILFPYDIESNREKISRLKHCLSSLSGADCNIIYPCFTALSPLSSAALRINILKAVYKDEYYTDSYDMQNIEARIRNYQELIWFWGPKEVVSKAKLLLESNTINMGDTPQKLGTVSLINAASEFNKGTAELCRSGSLDSYFGAKYSSLKRVIDYIDNRTSYIHRSFHTLCFVPRARRTSETVRGGEAVNKLHREYIRSHLWGYAPWYVMQDSKLELLEYKEINRDFADVIQAVKNTEALYIADEEASRFVHSLFIGNTNFAPPILNSASRACGMHNQPANFNYYTVETLDPKIKEFNHQLVVVDLQENFQQCIHTENKTIIPFTVNDICIDKHQTSACMVYKVNIEHPASLDIQIELKNKGYRLLMITPPKETWIYDNSGNLVNLDIPCYGFWNKTNPAYTMEYPFYFYADKMNALTDRIISYVKDQNNFV